MLNIFMLNNFLGKSVFSGVAAKNCSGGDHWLITFNTPYTKNLFLKNTFNL